MTQPQVVVLGDANVDMVIRLPDRSSGTPDLAHSIPQLHGGGSAANAAVALARLGVGAMFVGTVGDDGYGRWVLENLGREGVDTHGVSLVHDAFTPMVMAVIEPNGERLVLVWPQEGGAHFHLRKDAINRSLLGTATWLHTTGMCLRASPAREAMLHAMELARQEGLRVSLDLNLRLESWGLDDTTRSSFERAIELSDVLFGNAEEEIIPIAGEGSVEAAIIKLSEGERTVVARGGERGAWVATYGETFHVPAFHAAVVDTLGAGDAFDGGFIAASLEDVGVREATRWGHAAAAYKIGQVGARGLPSRDDVEHILHKPQNVD
ncbi:MAG: carbohydrate kinase family protein [Anaerolineales bacterium]